MINSTLFRVIFGTITILGFLNVQAQKESFVMTTIGQNNLLDNPFDLHYGPDGYLWVTERVKGIVVRINRTTGERDELIKIADVSSTASQDGLLGIALSDGILNDKPYVYLSYTHLVSGQRKQKLVRYTYQITGNDGSLSSPFTLIDNLPASNDHNSGRIIFGPDNKLYYSIGDQGNNQNSNYCTPILAQVLPTQKEIDQQDWTNYPGKILRLNIDGTIPNDNPVLEGVQSHIYSFGHRNPQGLIFGDNGLLYSCEHGPNTDDEANIIYSGSNYGWPNVVGFQDDQAYGYCNWSSVSNCQSLSYSVSNCPPSATYMKESSFIAANYKEPLFSMFAVPDNYNYNDPKCSDAWICRPNVAPSSIAFYGSDAIPSWKNSILVVSLKRGRIYRFKLDENGTAIIGDTIQHFYTPNRYRDMVIDPDGKSFYLITDGSGKTSDASGFKVVTNLQNKGAILKFTIDETVSTENQNDESILKIWPNPSSEKMYVALNPLETSEFKSELINSQGTVVRKMNSLQSGINEININDLPSGIYVFKLYTNYSLWHERVIIKK